MPAVLDSAAPPPAIAAPAPRPAPAPTDFYPRDDRERELCRTASTTDWLYLAIGPAAVAGSVVFDHRVWNAGSPVARLTGPLAVGLAWGFTLGAIYPSLPKCSSTWVGEDSREGGSRRSWPLALSVALLAGLSAPIFLGVEQGYTSSPAMSVGERQARLFVAGGAAMGGALLPYLLPPKTWRAARELENLRAMPLENGMYLGWGGRF